MRGDASDGGAVDKQMREIIGDDWKRITGAVGCAFGDCILGIQSESESYVFGLDFSAKQPVHRALNGDAKRCILVRSRIVYESAV